MLTDKNQTACKLSHVQSEGQEKNDFLRYRNFKCTVFFFLVASSKLYRKLMLALKKAFLTCFLHFT